MKNDEYLKRLKDHLDENYCSRITLDELAKMFYVSKFCMSRGFKERFGTTILNYILDKRMDNAKKLLSETSLSSEQIAKKCGFSGINYFARQFKKREGMTSLEYRKMHGPKNKEEE